MQNFIHSYAYTLGQLIWSLCLCASWASQRQTQASKQSVWHQNYFLVNFVGFFFAFLTELDISKPKRLTNIQFSINNKIVLDNKENCLDVKHFLDIKAQMNASRLNLSVWCHQVSNASCRWVDPLSFFTNFNVSEIFCCLCLSIHNRNFGHSGTHLGTFGKSKMPKIELNIFQDFYTLFKTHLNQNILHHHRHHSATMTS